MLNWTGGLSDCRYYHPNGQPDQHQHEHQCNSNGYHRKQHCKRHCHHQGQSGPCPTACHLFHLHRHCYLLFAVLLSCPMAHTHKGLLKTRIQQPLSQGGGGWEGSLLYRNVN
ncbi:hypothetical protein GJAV_G00116190 [Gymnothorax javanicus]|nr:hypothetical protein GJAV_G00116190 [Gymnothorax javanicus]